VWNVGWSWTQTRVHHVVPRAPARADIRSLARQALPFALAGLFVKVYSYLDTLMINAFHGSAAVGTYAVAYKVTYAFQFIPLVFTAALFPAMSLVHASGDRDKLKIVFSGAMRMMALIGAPLAAGLSAIADRFVPMVYGLEFLGSVAVLELLPWVLLPIFLDFPIGSLLNATHRAHLKTGAMGATMVVNAVLNAFLVPSFGPVGAAWAGVASFWFLLSVGVWFTRRDMPSASWIAWLLARSAFVAAATWLAVRGPGTAMPLPLTVLFGGACGVVALLVTQLLRVEDVRVALSWLKQRVKTPDPIDEAAHP
jgi:O-antigen/teichoic acid export membrane protein